MKHTGKCSTTYHHGNTVYRYKISLHDFRMTNTQNIDTIKRRRRYGEKQLSVLTERNRGKGS